MSVPFDAIRSFGIFKSSMNTVSNIETVLNVDSFTIFEKVRCRRPQKYDDLLIEMLLKQVHTRE